MATLTQYTLKDAAWSPMSESIRLALQAKNLSYESIDGGNAPGVLQKNGQEAKGYIATLRMIGEELGAQTLQDDDMGVLEYFINHVHPLFVKAVAFESKREGLDLFVEALAFLENRLVTPYYGGSSPNLLDYGLFPWFNKMGTWLPGVRASECPQIYSWLKRMRNDAIVLKNLETAMCDSNALSQFRAAQKERTIG